jgi:hypothetical protein
MDTQFPQRNIMQDTQHSNLDGSFIGVTCFSEKQHDRPLFANMNISYN